MRQFRYSIVTEQAIDRNLIQTTRLIRSTVGHRLSRGYFLRVAAPFLAEPDREAAERLDAALRAWRDNAFLDAALCPSRLSLANIARERFADLVPLPLLFALRVSRAACS